MFQEDPEKTERNGLVADDGLTADDTQATPDAAAASDAAEQTAPAASADTADAAAQPDAAPQPDADQKPAAAAEAAKEGSKPSALTEPRFNLVVLIAAVVVAAILFGLLGSCVGGGASGKVAAQISESQLDSAIATYTFNGTKHDVTAREIFASQYGVSSAADADGNYTTPSAETILSYVRNKVLVEDAAKQGIELDDAAVDAYTESLGYGDLTSVAAMLGVDEETARTYLRDAAMVQALNDQVASGAATMPAPPEEGKKGKVYGKYIAGLLGDEWDTGKDDWARDDGQLYAYLQGAKLTTGKKATYDMALTTYQAAYAIYSADSTNERQVWTDYTNGLFANTSVDIFGALQ